MKKILILLCVSFVSRSVESSPTSQSSSLPQGIRMGTCGDPGAAQEQILQQTSTVDNEADYCPIEDQEAGICGPPAAQALAASKRHVVDVYPEATELSGHCQETMSGGECTVWFTLGYRYVYVTCQFRVNDAGQLEDVTCSACVDCR